MYKNITRSDVKHFRDFLFALAKKTRCNYSWEESLGDAYVELYPAFKEHIDLNNVLDTQHLWNIATRIADQVYNAMGFRPALSTFVMPQIDDVIFNKPATIIKWSDGTKTVVKCQDGEPYDMEKGMAMCIAKKALGNQGSYYNKIRKPIEEYEKKQEEERESLCPDLTNMIKTMEKAVDALSQPKLYQKMIRGEL